MRKFIVLLAALAAVLVLTISPAAAQEPTIADIVVQSASGDPAEFTILLAAVQAADPSILAALSDPTASLTVFAPTDAAFERLLGRLGISAADLLSDTALLNDVLLYHVLPGEYDAATLFERAHAPWPGTYIQSLQGTYLEFTDDDGSLIVDASWVQAADIQASNGIVHVIYEVLLPSYNYGEEGLPGA